MFEFKKGSKDAPWPDDLDCNCCGPMDEMEHEVPADCCTQSGCGPCGAKDGGVAEKK